MASFEVSGITKLNEMFSKLADIPDEVKTDTLKAMGSLGAEKIKQVGKEMNVYDPGWTGKHVLESIKINKPKLEETSGSITVTFSGTRKRGNTVTRNAAIAFINEYGKKNMASKPFVSAALEKYKDSIIEAGEKVFDDWIYSVE